MVEEELYNSDEFALDGPLKDSVDEADEMIQSIPEEKRKKAWKILYVVTMK